MNRREFLQGAIAAATAAGLRGHEAVWRRPIAHRTDREFESGAIKHIISFRIAVKA